MEQREKMSYWIDVILTILWWPSIVGVTFGLIYVVAWWKPSILHGDES